MQAADAVPQSRCRRPAAATRSRRDGSSIATGIRSPLRDMLGLQTRAEVGMSTAGASRDVRFRHEPQIERWTWIEAPFNQNRAVWQHLMADDVWRLDYQMDADADPGGGQRARRWLPSALRAQFGDDVDYELVWVGPYGYRSHVMERFREGRVFFAGDGAHGMSPFGARGGNSGIQDADNLVWKLAGSRRGRMRRCSTATTASGARARSTTCWSPTGPRASCRRDRRPSG